MARESAHKPRPTSEIASPQMLGRSTFGQTSLSSSSCETDDSDKTIQPRTIQQEQAQTTRSSIASVASTSYESHTSPLRLSSENIDELTSDNSKGLSKQQQQQKQDARQSNRQKMKDDILLLLLESHHDKDISVNHHPKTEKGSKDDWQQKVSKKNGWLAEVEGLAYDLIEHMQKQKKDQHWIPTPLLTTREPGCTSRVFYFFLVDSLRRACMHSKTVVVMGGVVVCFFLFYSLFRRTVLSTINTHSLKPDAVHIADYTLMLDVLLILFLPSLNCYR